MFNNQIVLLVVRIAISTLVLVLSVLLIYLEGSELLRTPWIPMALIMSLSGMRSGEHALINGDNERYRRNFTFLSSLFCYTSVVSLIAGVLAL